MVHLSTKDETKKELKVKLPRRLQIQLHSAKITNGLLIYDVVTEALTQYFEEHGDPDMTGFVVPDADVVR